MKALVFTLAGLMISQAAHAVGCSEADAKRLVLERIVNRAEGADFTEVKIHVEKTRHGNGSSSMYGTHIIPNASGSNQYGWVNVEISTRNACINSGVSSGDLSELRGSNPTVRLNDYLRDNQMGSLMRHHTPRGTDSSEMPTPALPGGPMPMPVPSAGENLMPTPSHNPVVTPSPAPPVDGDE